MAFRPAGHRPERTDRPERRRTDLPLELLGRRVAGYIWRNDLPAALAPRPHLHPVTTLGGTTVTEVMPASHRHHLGVSIAVPEVDRANFWGGRTFIPGHGPAWLDNHGTQHHVRWVRRTPTMFSELLDWVAVDGDRLLAEQRTVSCETVGDGAWALDLAFTLTNVSGRPLEIRSPASRGRAGAGYGGYFWRAPAAGPDTRAFTPDGEGTDAVHGCTAPWLAVTGHTPESSPWTMVFVGATTATRQDRWFVRTRDYTGIGSALSWNLALSVDPDAALHRRIVTVIADGILPRHRIAALAERYTP
jgi:hypothetical protein